MQTLRRGSSFAMQVGAALTLSGAIAPGNAALGAEQYYVGAGVGYSTAGGCEIDVSALNDQVRDCDSKSIEPKLYAGFHFNEYLGIEVGYSGLNSTEFTLKGGGGAKFDATGIPIQAIVFLPYGSALTAIGKLGLVRWKIDFQPTFANRASDSGFALAASAGAEYLLAKRISVRGEVDYFPKVGDENTVGEKDIVLYGVSVKWSF